MERKLRQLKTQVHWNSGIYHRKANQRIKIMKISLETKKIEFNNCVISAILHGI